MLELFNQHIDNTFPYLKDSKLLIAISGGLDSVVLAHLCQQYNLDYALAHCNFNLRGVESDADENFVLELGNQLDVEVFVQHFNTEDYAFQHKLSTQMAARKLRYDWFNELSEQLNFDYILTAHHADDNLETILINLSRGTGIEGLIGIPEQNGKIIRPLLKFSREAIAAYAKQHDILWREDASNTSDKYLRNALRHHIVPKLKELNPQLLQNLAKTSAHLQESQQIINDRVKKVSNKVVTEDDDGNLVFHIAKINKLSHPKAYLFQLLKNYGFTAWHDVVDLLEAQSGKFITSSTHRLIKNRKKLILSYLNNNIDEEFRIHKDSKKNNIHHGVLWFDEADAVFEKQKNIAVVDKDLLKFPLTVRRWQEGDYFYPIGMKGKKKLSKFFKDEKLSLIDKENTWLLCTNTNDIIWIINKRLDNRFKVTSQTKNKLKITYTK